METERAFSGVPFIATHSTCFLPHSAHATNSSSSGERDYVLLSKGPLFCTAPEDCIFVEGTVAALSLVQRRAAEAPKSPLVCLIKDRSGKVCSGLARPIDARGAKAAI